MIKNIMANECFDILKTEKSSRLIDVRTSHEWHNNGYADLEALGKKVHLISLTNEDHSPSTNFIDQINKLDIKPKNKIFFICKSGMRSLHAGNLLREDFVTKEIFNVKGGMEYGWKHFGLPVFFNIL
ncbi:rhodanese-like domain-containing protein [Pelagibacterales bacterium]|nr:rhodanese-like domain-containing protein [Pelagibacterales bacterium]